MTTPVIEVEGVGKRYRLGRGYGDQSDLSQRIDAAMRYPFRRLTGRGPVPAPERGEEFWALRDVSFQVAPGEVIGFIGANGAGKSTLLKLLSRITPPTEGKITLRGKVGSLLEVGTGFHPELTGRENVFLNGAILGMRKREIYARYDEIIEFSGIEQFIETPVKRYSSGMFVRLAFAVAAHLEPEILLVDEVLSVGDAEFQRRCLGKMEDVASQGRTIVFVSHNMSTLRRVCDRAVLIEKGRMTADGPADKTVADYLERVQPVQHGGLSVVKPETLRVGTGQAAVKRVSLRDQNGELIDQVFFGQRFTVSIEAEVREAESSAVFLIGISTTDGERIVTAHSTDRGGAPQRLEPGTVEATAGFDVTLLPGEFVVDVGVIDVSGRTIDYVQRVLSFTARSVGPEGSDDGYPWDTVNGYVRPTPDWTLPEQGAISAAGQRITT